MNINLINIINNDFITIINYIEIEKGIEDELFKFTICYRFITTCLLLIDICDSKFESILVKKMLIIYNLVISFPNILNYDTYIFNIYNKLKKYNKYTQVLHYNLYKNNINIEYNLNMIYFYNNNEHNLENIYNFYFDYNNFNNCFKLINNFTNIFWKKAILYNHTCNFKILKTLYKSIIENSKQNNFPSLLFYLGINKEIINSCLINYFEKNNHLHTNLNKNISSIDNTNYITAYIVDNQNYIYNYPFNQANTFIYLLDTKLNFNKKNNVFYVSGNIKNDLKLILNHKINILINLCSIDNNYSYELMANRIANIQINYLNYLYTTKTNIVDYVITDKYSITDELKSEFSEKLVIMPTFLIPNNYKEKYSHILNKQNNYETISSMIFKKTTKYKIDTKELIVKYLYKILHLNINNYSKNKIKDTLINRITYEIQNDTKNTNFNLLNSYSNKIKKFKKKNFRNKQTIQIYLNIILPKCKNKSMFKMCCLSNSKKLSNKDIIIFKLILKTIPNSVLYILENEMVLNRNNILTEIGDSYKNRIYFMPRIEKHLHLIRLTYFDCILDTFNYNLKHSCYDVLWLGIPIICLEGDKLETRITSSILKHLNLNNLIAETQEQYISIIKHLENDKNYYKYTKSLVENIRNNNIFKQTYFCEILNNLKKSVIKNYNTNHKNNIIINEQH